ncbi:MAG: DUF371 domain-containing protein [Candidatus Bathyarchaeia archaeon]
MSNLYPVELKEVILASGHENISATHETTIEITKEAHLSQSGDCIIAVSANKALSDLSSEFKKNLLKDHARITISVDAGGVAQTLSAHGSSRLILTHPTDIVVRKSSYVCDRTLAIHADQAACELSRSLVKKLKNKEQNVRITLTMKI